MLNAIQQGIITSSTKQRLDELEGRKEELEICIAQEQMEKPVLTKEQIVFWISRFKDGDIDDVRYQRSIIDIFVNSVYVYDDKMILMYNYKDGAKTITFDDIERSDLVSCTPPRRYSVDNTNPLSTFLFCLSGRLVIQGKCETRG
ncbi:MAG: hypothetical protein ACOYU3_02440 [Bacillota bacterium]